MTEEKILNKPNLTFKTQTLNNKVKKYFTHKQPKNTPFEVEL